MIRCSCLLLLLSSAIINLVCASYVTHPNINFDPLQQLGISGSYNGISLYKDTRQLTTIAKSTSSVISLSNDTLQLIASSNINGTIYDACIFNSNTLILAGNFTSINNQPINNIASIDLTSNTIKSMEKGLDGPVYSIYCDTNSVYVGGSFTAPSTNDVVSYSNSLSQFGGSVALWKNNQWSGLPWKGLNGPVYSILKNKNGQIIFGGKFDTTTDGQTFHAPASQPVNIPATGVTATSGTNPSAILCAPSSASSSWLLSDGVQGTWQTSFINYNVNPSLVRIVNSKVDNHQTKEFSIRSLTDGAIYPLAYLDPVSGIAMTCTTNCSLSNNPAVTYQDFRILNTSMTSGIAIDIKSWYGVGGGLSSVKVFQSEIFSYAVNTDASNICATNMTLPKVTTSGGNWTKSADTTSPYLSYAVKSATDTSSVTLYPNLAESGVYEVLIYTPQCTTTGCTDRTDVDILISTSASATVSNITMSQKYPGSLSVYTGYFDVSSTFEPTVKFSLASNASITSGKTSNLVAFAVQFVKDATNDELSSILQYNSTQTNITLTSLPWGSLPDNVPYKSVVETMQLSSNGDIYIGGNFTGTDKTNAKYTNIVQFDSSANQLKALTSGGLNGPVQSIAAIASEIYVGGNFSGVSSTTGAKIDYLSNVARYDIKKATWSPLDGGVNGPVKSINVLSNSVLVSGDFTQLTKTSTETYYSKAAGNAWWNSQNNQWILDSSVPYLSGTVYSAFVNNNIDYFIGNVKSAQRYQSNGISFVASVDTLTSPSFYPDGSQSSVSVSSGVLFNSNSGVTTTTSNATTTSTTIFGGTFTLPNNIQNIAIYYNNNNTWSGVQGAGWQGQISTMAVDNDLLYVGGRFSGSTSNNLAIFSLSNKSLSLYPNVQTNDGSPANVNIIRHIPTQNSMIVGGNFSSVGSLTCSSICALNTASLQWNTLGSGLVGEVFDMVLVNGKLVTSGNLSLNNSPLPIAQFDFDKNTWGPFATADLPGPSRSISYDNLTNYLYISGQTSNTSATYLRIWDGQEFNAPADDLGSGSVISKLTMLPIKNATSQKNILLATGFINLGTLGNVSAAFYDGEDWIPYLVTSNANGDSTASLSNLFYLDQPFITPTIKHYLPTPIVILVAIAVSLGIVFLIVLGAMVIIFVKRKRDSKVNPESNPAAYYGKPPRTPQSLLTMLEDASPDDKGDDGNNFNNDGNTAEKSRHLEPGTQQFYNMSRSISTDHLHEQALTPFNGGATATTTARAAPLPPTTHSRSISNHNAFNNMSPAAAAAIGAAGGGAIATGALAAARPESYARPVSEYQRDSNSFYNNEYTNTNNREMSEVPSRQSSYNPFRNSEIGVALGGTAAATAAAGAAGAFSGGNNNRSMPSNDTGYNNNFASQQQKGQTVTYGNIPPANASTSAVGATATFSGGNNNRSMPSNDTDYNNGFSPQQQKGQAVTCGNIPHANASTAAVGAAATFSGGNNNRSIRSNDTGYNNNFASQQQKGQAVTYGNIPPTNASTAAVTDAIISGGAVAAAFADRNISSSSDSFSQQQTKGGHPVKYGNIPPHTTSSLSVGSPETVRWTTAPTEAAIYAVVKPVSLVGTSDESSLLGPISEPQATKAANTAAASAAAEKVRWTNAPSSKDALATAFVVAAPVIAVHASDDNEDHQQENIYHNPQPNGSSLSVNNPNNSSNDVSSSTVRWTNYDPNNALGVATVEPTSRESTYHDHGSFYSPVPLNIGSSSNHSLLDTVNTTSEGLSSDPDIVRWTTAPASNIGTATVEPIMPSDERSSSTLGRSQYQASLSSVVAWPHDMEYQAEDDHSPNAAETHIDAEIAAAAAIAVQASRTSGAPYKDDVNTKVMHKNAFRLSDAGSLQPIDTNVFNNHHGGNHQEALLSPDSAVRWKTANVGSPIETAYAPNILEPATATVTRRSANDDNNDLQAFENYYHPKPQQATIVPNPSTSSSSKNKYKPVVNSNHNNYAVTEDKKEEEPVGRKSEAIDDVIAKRDLDALSIIIQDEEDEPVNPLYNTTPIPTSTRSGPSPTAVGGAGGAGAMDGRAASKRMVEDYLLSRNNKLAADDSKDKKSKYKSDFKSVMAAAILNNTKSATATEDQPHLYYAKFDFSAREHGELGFEKADPIIVVDSSDDIWWMGYKADKSDGSYIQGVFPSNYVEIATELRS